jgi:hypothetical protein
MSYLAHNRSTMFSSSQDNAVKAIAAAVGSYFLGNDAEDKGYQALLSMHIEKVVGADVLKTIMNAVNMLVMTKVRPVMTIDQSKLGEFRSGLADAIELVKQAALSYVPKDPATTNQVNKLRAELDKNLVGLKSFTEGWGNKTLEQAKTQESTFEAARPAMVR